MRDYEWHRWHRSSFCASGACVDVRREEDVVLVRRTGEDSPTLEFTEDEWADVLIEVRDESSGLVTMLADGVCLTDSHIRHLHVTEDEWNAFVAGVKAGEFEIERLSSGDEAGSGFRGVARSGQNAATGAGAIAVPPVPVAAQPRYILDKDAILGLVQRYGEAERDAADSFMRPAQKMAARDEADNLLRAIGAALTPVPDVEPEPAWGSGPLVKHVTETPGQAVQS